MNSSASVEKVVFHADGLQLTGFLHLPRSLPAPLVIGSHGMLSDSSSPKQVALGNRLSAIGVAFFRFDHRGCGQSEGVFREVTTLEARCRDLLAAEAYLESNFKLLPELALFGSSLGGTTCIAVADRFNDRLRAMVCLAAPVRSRPVIDAARARADVAPEDIDLLQQRLTFDVTSRLRSLRDILVIHGERDEIVPLEHGQAIYRSATESKKLIILPGGDHRVSDPVHQETVIQESVSWLLDHLKDSTAV